MRTGTSILVSVEGSEILKQIGCLCIYTLPYKQVGMNKYRVFSTFSKQCKKNTHQLRVLTRDLVLQYNWSNLAVTKGAAPVPPTGQSKLLPSFVRLVLSQHQVTERQTCHPNGLIFKFTGCAYFFKSTSEPKDAEICLGP